MPIWRDSGFGMAGAGRYVRLWGLVGGALFFLAALYVTIDMNSRGISTSAPVRSGPILLVMSGLILIAISILSYRRVV